MPPCRPGPRTRAASVAALSARPVAGFGARLLPLRTLSGLLLALGLLSLQAGQGTLAYFTSDAASTGNWFMTGKLLMKLADANETESPAITASFGSDSFRPGDTVAGYIVVQNSGDRAFHYTLAYTATNTSGTLWVAGPMTPTLQVFAADAIGSCSVANVTGARSGLTSAYGATPISTTPDAAVFSDAGGSKRLLNGGTSEVLCFAVGWPDGGAGAENAQTGASGTLALAFDAS